MRTCVRTTRPLCQGPPEACLDASTTLWKCWNKESASTVLFAQRRTTTRVLAPSPSARKVRACCVSSCVPHDLRSRLAARYYCDHCRVALCANAQRNCWKEWHRRPNMQRTCVGGAIAVDTGVAEADSDCSTASEESCDSDAEWVEVGEETTRVTYTYGAYGGDVSDADCGDGVSSDDSSGDAPFE